MQAIRERVISMLANVSAELAEGVASGIGIDVPAAQERVLASPATPEVTRSPALSLMARPGSGGIRGRQIALLVADGVAGDSLRTAHAALAGAGAAPRFVGARLGKVTPRSGAPIHVEVTLETAPSVVWDAVVVPAGDDSLAALGQAVDFVKDPYRHGKGHPRARRRQCPVAAAKLPRCPARRQRRSGLDHGRPSRRCRSAVAAFIAAVAKHRVYERETDPPRV